MITGIDVGEVVEFVCAKDKDTEKPTTFLLGTLTNREKLKIVGGAVTNDGKVDISKLQDKAVDILKAGVKGIKNLYNAKKKKAEDITVITEEVIDRLPINVLSELLGKVLEINLVQDEDTKN